MQKVGNQWRLLPIDQSRRWDRSCCFLRRRQEENLQTLSKIEYIIERYENGNKREEGSYLNGKKRRFVDLLPNRWHGITFVRLTNPAGRIVRRLQKFKE